MIKKYAWFCLKDFFLVWFQPMDTNKLAVAPCFLPWHCGLWTKPKTSSEMDHELDLVISDDKDTPLSPGAMEPRCKILQQLVVCFVLYWDTFLSKSFLSTWFSADYILLWNQTRVLRAIFQISWWRLTTRECRTLRSPECSGDHSMEQTDLEFRDSPASVSQVMGLKPCATTAWLSCSFQMGGLKSSVREKDTMW